MNGVVYCNPIGSLFGNATMSWLHAYAHAQRVGAEFVCGPWIGEKILDLPKYNRPVEGLTLPRRTEMDLKPDETNVEIRTYAQSEKAMIYTRAQARAWLKPRYTLDDVVPECMRGSGYPPYAAHRRVGDYIGYGFPVVSMVSIERGIRLAGFEPVNFWISRQENPTPVKEDLADIPFVADFLKLMHAEVLFRGNSTFSWVAALLGTALVYAPMIQGCAGGQEHHVIFVEGNWPRLANHEFTTDLVVAEA